MAFLGSESLKNLLSGSSIILDDKGDSCYDESRVEQACYALSLGVEAYRTDNKDRKIENLTEINRTVEINPGQFALLMTKEFVNVPQDMLAFISIKAKNKLKGLVNVSGFHVDPGFRGRLLFSVYNAGPSTITLQTGDPYFLIWFTELDKSTEVKDQYNEKENHHQGQSTIKLEYIDALKRGELASPNALLEKINKSEDLLKLALEQHSSTITQKISKTEDSLQRIIWIGSIVIGAAIAIGLKVLWDNEQYKKGYMKRVEDEKVAKEITKKVSDFTKDTIYLHKIDSLISSRLQEQKQKDVNKK
ncbi:deoxycytidine triphosphate deaminase [Chryseobacterium sp. Tr-659]|uniref:dCTP deaminase domain-containing protein n=1 Tax=Chryseobacterium sp. Tr-659 TaxID=2608340 RepID=UPI001423BE61|nr:deoxycytidine triphosphate deaminase [Chryseobacterium sp. Tr-659]NIF07102.1 deoxycytidine triphosphate deaminase [Chryseobacterium sp. Tr-659]